MPLFGCYRGSRKTGVRGMQKTRLSTGAAIAFFAASSAAFAADIGRQAPPPMLMPLYNWTGFYVGGNLGGAWASGTLTDSFSGASFTGNHSGFIGGGQIGYNWQVAPQFVVGVE